MDKIFSKDKRFVDSHGRERIFFGMNVTDKQPFGCGKTSHAFTKDFVKGFSEYGFNTVRLGFTWSAVEPSPGCYNTALLDSIKEIIRECEKYDIFVFLDIHQDLYSDVIDKAGDGAPPWAVFTDGKKVVPHRFVWADRYFFGSACHKAFDNFWNNRKVTDKGITDCFADMWSFLAKYFSDCPNVFGFDMLNEPFPGTDGGKIFRKVIGKLVGTTLFDKRIKKSKLISSLFKKNAIVPILEQYTGELFLKITGAGNGILASFDKNKYSPFLNKVSSAVRNVTDDGILFIEGNYYSNIGMLSGTDPITVNGKRDANQCYSPHGYDFFVDTDLYKYASDSRVGAIFARHKITQDRLNVPVLVGEWGGSSSGTEWLSHLEFLLDLFDSYRWSSTYWTFSSFESQGHVCDILRRPRPVAVTGVINSYRYDRENDTFTLDFTQDEDFSVPTEIYCHKKVKEVVTDGEYEFVPLCESSGKLLLKTAKGNHCVTVKF